MSPLVSFHAPLRRLTLLIVLLLAGSFPFLAARPLYAANIVVNTTAYGEIEDNKCSLVEAILAANTNSPGLTGDCTPGDDIPVDTIILQPTTYPQSGTFDTFNALPPITSTIVISGNGATLERTGVDQFRHIQVLNTGDLTINDLTLTQGNTPGGGGAIFNEHKLTLIDSRLFANHAANSGGALNNSGGDLSVVDTKIFSNTAFIGGGLYNVISGTVTISNSRILTNEATSGSGGGIFNSNFSHVNLTGSTIGNNRASSSGGGIFNDQHGAITMTNSYLQANTADEGGGIESRNSGHVTLIGSYVLTNTAPTAAGISNLQGSVLTLIASSILSNTSTGGGGGLYNSVNSLATLIHSSIVSNTANSGGAMINSENSTTILTNTRIVSNTSISSGGAIINMNHGILRMTDSHILDNVAIQGGAIYNENYSQLYASNSELSGNRAIDQAGAIYNEFFSTVAVTDSQIISNHTNRSGGAIFNNSTSTTTVSGGEISLNSAVQGGGVYNNGTSVTISHTLISNNRASDRGGAMQLDQGVINIEQSCIIGNSDVAVVVFNNTTIDAPNNFWGASDGPSGVGPGTGDSVSESVVFTPFLTAAANGCPGPRLELSLKGNPNPARSGDVIQYSAFITNVGTVELVTIQGEDLKAGATFTTTTPIAVGDAVTPTVHYQYTVTPADFATGIITNTLELIGADALSNEITTSATITTTIIPFDVNLPLVTVEEPEP